MLATSGSPLSWCGSSTDILSFSELTMTPYPVVAGQDVLVNITGSLSHDITQGAKAKVTTKLGPVPVFSLDIDICSALPSGQSCPISAQNGAIQSLLLTRSVPGLVPGGSFKMQMYIADGDGSSIGCLFGNIQIVH